MYDQDYRQYIIKQSTGRIWNLFFDEKAGLCYSILTRRNAWTNPVSIQKDALQYFCAEVDNDDVIHILSQDKNGNILYSRIDGETMKTLPVLSSKTPSAYDKCLHMVPGAGTHNFFYVLQHGNSWILSHQVLSDGKSSTPRVVDYVIKSSRPYSLISDTAGSIYAFYPASDGRYYQMGYKKYIPAQKYWSEFTPVSRFEGDCEIPSAVADGKNIIHICYQRRSSRQYELVYQQKVPDKNIWTDEAVIHSSSYPFNNSSILIAGDNIFIFWVRDDIIYYSSSRDWGITWTKPAKYSFTAGRQLICMAYRTNSPYESGKIFARDIPGCFINGLMLAFLQDMTGTDGNLSAKELKDMIVDSLKMLKGDVEDLKDSEVAIREDISKLYFNQDSLEKELTKLSLRFDMLENGSGGPKPVGSRLESLEKRLYDIARDIQRLQDEISGLKEAAVKEN